MAKARPETPNIIEFITDPQLLGLTLSPAQTTLHKSLDGLPLTGDELDLWSQCTGRTSYPARPFGEATVLVGARGGKDSRIACPKIVHEAVFGGHERHLAKGERAVVPLIAPGQRQTQIAFGYVRDYFMHSSLLASMIEEPLAQEIRLTNRVNIFCFPCTQKSLRGWSIPVGVMDELAYFRLEGQADSDAEVQASIRRGMLSFADPRLVKISTPYMKSGVLYEDFAQYFGQDSPDVLVWKASSVLMNPSLRAERLERERRLDPLRFSREYEAEFAEDLESFLPAAWVDGAVVTGRYELPPQDDSEYVAACDPSGGGADAFTLSIVHADGAGADCRLVQDVCKGWQRSRSRSVDLEGVVKHIAVLLRAYRVMEIRGDRYAAGWVRQAFEREEIRYREAELDRSQAYLELEPLFAQGRIELLDHPLQQRQLKTLERRPRPGGKVLVDHPQRGHDDFSNSLALAAAAAASQVRRPPVLFWTAGEFIQTKSADQLQAEANREHGERRAEAARLVSEAIARDGCWFPGG